MTSDIIVLDADEVLLVWYAAAARELRRRTGVSFDPRDLRGPWPDVSLLTGPEAFATYREIRRDPAFLLSQPPFPGALEGVRELRRRGHRLVVCTAVGTEQSVVAARKKRLHELFGAHRFHDIRCVDSPDDKPYAVSDIGTIRAVVDDHAPTVERFLAAGVPALLFDRPWNRETLLPRVRGWSNLVPVVTSVRTALRLPRSLS